MKKQIYEKEIRENRDVSIRDHINELKEFVFRPLEIKQTTYEKAEQIGRITKPQKSVQEIVESVIDSMYISLKESGEL